MKNIQLKLKTSLTINSRLFYICLCSMFWSYGILVTFTRATINRIIPIEGFAQAVITALFVFCIFGAINYMRHRIRFKDILLYVLFVAVYFLDYYLRDCSNEYVIENAVNILLTIVPMYFIGICLDDDGIIDVLHVISLISIYVQILYVLVIGVDMSGAADHEMGLAYSLLPHVTIVFFYLMRKFSFIDLISCVIGAILILSYGTRGPVLGMALFVMIYLLMFKQYKHRFLVYGGYLLILSAIAFFFDSIIMLVRNIVASLGMSTRVIDLIIMQNLSDDNGRNMIIDRMALAVEQKPYSGYGFAGDRLFDSSYAHNIVWEFWVSFGQIIGTAVLIILVILVLRAVFTKQSQKSQGLLLMLICGTGFVKLLFSGSYLIEPSFFLMIGFSVSVIRRYGHKGVSLWQWRRK